MYGQILSPEGKVVHNLFGKWNEALYFGHAPSSRCVWRPGKGVAWEGGGHCEGGGGVMRYLGVCCKMNA